MTLKDSPLFAMSRGGKELFHTNFIAFVLEFDSTQLPKSAGQVFEATRANLLTLFFGDNAPAKVITWREKSSLDLVVMAAPEPRYPEGRRMAAFDGQPDSLEMRKRMPLGSVERCVAVVVEAKLKALPTAKQLERYNTKLTKGLLLDFEEIINVEDHSWGRVGVILEKSQVHGEGQPSYARLWAYDKPPGGTLEESDADPVAVSSHSKSETTRYSKFAGTRALLRRILLSPGDAASATHGTGWEPLGFDKFIAAFPTVRPADKGLYTGMLWDYAESTRALLGILKRIETAVAAFARDSSEPFSDLSSFAAHQSFAQRRIHDVVGKFAFDSFRQRMMAALRTQQSIESGGCEFRLDSYTFMSNGMPGVGFEWKAEGTNGNEKHVFSVGIQIQGTASRRFVSASEPSHRQNGGLMDLAKELGNPLHGHSGDDWWRSAAGKSTVQKTKAFDGFGRFNEQAFLYTAGDIGALNFRDLVAAIQEALALAGRCITSNLHFGAMTQDFLEGGNLGREQA